MRIEQSILSNLIVNEEYCRKVIPHIKREYFSDRKESTIYTIIGKFFDQYNKPASKEIVLIELGNVKGISDKELVDCLDYVQQLDHVESNSDWLIDETEKFCKSRAVYNAILESIKIIDGKDQKNTQDEIGRAHV